MYNCYNTGNLSGANCQGGIVGSASKGNIYNCYNKGNFSNGYISGGITAWNNNVYNCYNVGNGTTEDFGSISCWLYADISYNYALTTPYYIRTTNGTYSNLSVFTKSGTTCTLSSTILNTTNLVTVLNKYITDIYNGTLSLDNWYTDSSGINGGYPILQFQNNN